MEGIRILSVYCQVLCDKKKREDVFDYFRNKKYNIYCLQDTHFTQNEENAIEVLWGYKCFHSTQTSNSRGVSILFNNNFDMEGNYVALDVVIETHKLTLISLSMDQILTPQTFMNKFQLLLMILETLHALFVEISTLF